MALALEAGGIRPLKALSAEARIAVWEHTRNAHPIDQGLAVLREALPSADADDLVHLPLGTRDALLLAVREASLGDRIAALYSCPACGETLELDLSCTTLLAAGESTEMWEEEIGSFRLTLRSLNSADAAAAASAATVALGAELLLERAVVFARSDGVPVSAASLPPSVRTEVAESLAGHDPGAECLLECLCPACGHAGVQLLDVAPFVAAELAASGRRILADIDVIARAYGWDETEILALSETRRRTYVELAQG